MNMSLVESTLAHELDQEQKLYIAVEPIDCYERIIFGSCLPDIINNVKVGTRLVLDTAADLAGNEPDDLLVWTIAAELQSGDTELYRSLDLSAEICKAAEGPEYLYAMIEKVRRALGFYQPIFSGIPLDSFQPAAKLAFGTVDTFMRSKQPLINAEKRKAMVVVRENPVELRWFDDFFDAEPGLRLEEAYEIFHS